MRSLLTVSLLLLTLCSAAFADVAPDPGFKYLPVDLILEPKNDLSSFRFFLLSPGDLEEVRVAGGSSTVVSGRYRAGINLHGELFAVPISDIGSAQPDEQDPSGFKSRYPSAHKVLSHTFRARVSIIEEPFWKPPVYEISFDGRVVKGTKVPGGTDTSLVMYMISAGVAAVLIAIGIAIMGIWLLRRSREKV